jgi:hypothetical protein
MRAEACSPAPSAWLVCFLLAFASVARLSPAYADGPVGRTVAQRYPTVEPKADGVTWRIDPDSLPSQERALLNLGMAKARRGRRGIVVAVLPDRVEVTAKRQRRSIIRELRTGIRKPPRRPEGKVSETPRSPPKGSHHGR